MLGLAITFLIVAVIAALLGFTGAAVISVEVAKLLFFIFIILFIVSLFFGYRGRRGSPPI